MPKLLIADDEADLLAELQPLLERSGFVVVTAGDGQQGLDLAPREQPDLIVLDVMMPKIDGLALLPKLRDITQAPILMLTAKGETADKVATLGAGADDYLVKPFVFEEFLARIRALTRRHLTERTAILQVGELRLDTRSGTVTVAGRPLPLTMNEFAILEYLMHNPNRLVARNQIAEHVWGYDFSSESNLVEVYIARLRRKLMAGGFADRIKTVRYGGYRLERA